jgi:hypothetical protein
MFCEDEAKSTHEAYQQVTIHRLLLLPPSEVQIFPQCCTTLSLILYVCSSLIVGYQETRTKLEEEIYFFFFLAKFLH